MRIHPWGLWAAAVAGVADARRGLVPKAFIVSDRSGPEFARELQAFVRRTMC